MYSLINYNQLQCLWFGYHGELLMIGVQLRLRVGQKQSGEKKRAESLKINRKRLCIPGNVASVNLLPLWLICWTAESLCVTTTAWNLIVEKKTVGNVAGLQADMLSKTIQAQLYPVYAHHSSFKSVSMSLGWNVLSFTFWGKKTGPKNRTHILIINKNVLLLP